MDKELLKKRLILLLVLFIIVALFGVAMMGAGKDMGIVAVIFGVVGCFPVLWELSRLGKPSEKHDGEEQ